MNRIALLIPHYNNLDALRSSLQSIHPEDPADIVVVDDGSARPPTEALIRDWSPGPREVHLIRLRSNAGIEWALNAGLDFITSAGYELVARLDCGDRNVGMRFTKQIRFLDAHPDTVLLGGAAQFVDMEGNDLFVRTMPTDHEEIVRFMRSNNAFMHPTVVFRSSALANVGHYPADYPAAEDYAFFWLFLKAGRVANLADVLITYEVDPGSISRGKRSTQLRSRLAVQQLHSDGSLRSRKGILRTRVLLASPVHLVDRVKARMYAQP